MPTKTKQIGMVYGATSAKRAVRKPFVPIPNPQLHDFIANHTAPYDPSNDHYDVGPFDLDIVVDKSQKPKAIYDMQSYWSKKHWAAIRSYIRHYLPQKFYDSGEGLVLDCFSGSGMTGVAAGMEDRPCILIDVSPAAAFISHCYNHPADPDRLRDELHRMMTDQYSDKLVGELKGITGRKIQNLQEELEWLYGTMCDDCGGPAVTEWVVYSERFQCPACSKIVVLHDCPQLEEPKKGRYCHYCIEDQGGASRQFLISTRSKKFGAVPVLVTYTCLKCGISHRQRQPSKDDLKKIAAIEKSEIPHVYPKRSMMDVSDPSKPWGVKWRAGTSNFRTVAELYTKRNLWAMSACSATMEKREAGDALRLSLMGMALGVSRMNRYVPGHWSVQNRILSGTYYMPQLSTEVNIAPQLKKKVGVTVSALNELNTRLFGDVLVSCQASKSVSLPENSIDYIFTDPAYVDKIQYGELNFVWESWLHAPGDWLQNEIIVNPFRGKSVEDWENDIRAVMQNCYSALKPGRWLSLCYHDTDPGTWRRIQDVLLDTGFEIHTITVLDPKQKSSNQLKGEKVVKSDLVLNCRKPKVGEGQKDGDRSDVRTVSDRIRQILIEVLATTGGQTRDVLWDVVLKRLLARGLVAEHRFDDILAQIAIKLESGRWFLKEEFESLSQNDIKNEEDAGTALERFVRIRAIGVSAQIAAHIALEKPRLADSNTDEEDVEKYIKDNLIDDPAAKRKFHLAGRLKGIEFYDCLFFYLTRFLKGRQAGKIPRRNLAEFLEEYLVRFKDGDKWLYRPPDRSEAEALRASRKSGLGRRIRQYVAFLRGQGDFPRDKMPDPKTLLAWLKHCSGFGLVDEGVMLYERGGLMAQAHALSEDDRYDAEEYYLNCKGKSGKRQLDLNEDETEPDDSDDATVEEAEE